MLSSVGLLLGLFVSSAFAAEPVRMGCGMMTFDTVPGWGLDAAGKSQIGPTHGSVVIDSKRQVYTSSNLGIFVFTPDGTLVRRHLGGDYTSLHDMEIRTEDGRDFIYGARNAAGEGIKIDAETGAVVFK
ncbi:MAG: 6-bladed beta-propeller, partial [Planctomycetia bacterium]|nr:6-bladed beta-propeller [Planctomycetia bacterium]